MIFSPVNSTSSFVSASKYNSIASLIFLIASSLVSPSEMHPGRDGTYAVKPPSSCGSKTIASLIRENKQNKYINLMFLIPLPKNSPEFSLFTALHAFSFCRFLLEWNASACCSLSLVFNPVFTLSFSAE